MEQALRSLLRADASLAALVSTRVDWGRRPQSDGELPGIVLMRVGGRRDLNMGGASGLVESLVQVDCYGETYSDAKLAARAIRDIVNGFSGAQSGTIFQLISIDNERDQNETGPSEKHLHMISLDLTIWHDE